MSLHANNPTSLQASTSFRDACLYMPQPAKRASHPTQNGKIHRRAIISSDAFEIFCKGPSLFHSEALEGLDHPHLEQINGRGRSGSMEYFRFANEAWAIDTQRDSPSVLLCSSRADLDSDCTIENRSTRSSFETEVAEDDR